ncbi:MAG: hypothetical protein EOO89_11410 [Pedobacter sp.]|nr:MAG: hypothetical protein EOO89_11410 [Pedobacter sp.]
MNNAVKDALNVSLTKYAALADADATDFNKQLTDAFDKDAGFMEKVASFDKAFDDNPKFEELREVYFDLLMINFFTSDAAKLEEDYLESEEWANIEEETLDRGTELLNLLLYINECKDENIMPSLEDFLKEFLLVDEDEFQDEFHIYEDLISNQSLAESSIEDICNNAGIMNLNEEMVDLFVPFMTFFHQPDIDPAAVKELEQHSNNKEYDVAVYTLITNFNKIN